MPRGARGGGGAAALVIALVVATASGCARVSAPPHPGCGRRAAGDSSWLPEVADVFFVKGQPRTRRIFLRDPDGKPAGFVDRREGEDIRWRRLDR